MSYYIRNGNTFRVAATAAMDIQSKLPVGNYTIKIDPMENFYLEMIESFISPPKLYGDTIDNTARIINTFLERNNSTGVMLTGEKGSGKTLLAKNIALSASNLNIPTVVINAPWRGDKFNTFIQSIDQECVILFDEFEKVYNPEEQEEVLTLLDGVYPSKKLFIVTCNDKYRVDKHMRNRPGRIFYMLDFEGLAVEFIREYCQENLKNTQYIDNICTVSSIFNAFNFDMLKALVEEMNRYNETPQEALRLLNVKQEFDDGGKFDVELKYLGKVLTNNSRKDGWEGNPLNPKGIWVGFDNMEIGVKEEDSEWEDIKFDPTNLVKVDVPNGSFIFTTGDMTLTLTRKKLQHYSYVF